MITSITPQLFIGTADDSREIVDNNFFQSILNVAIDVDIDNKFKKRHKIGLVDGYGNDKLLFISAVITLHSLLKKGRVLLHCQAGASRSVMVAAAYLAATQVTDFENALNIIMKARKVDVYRPELYELAVANLTIIINLLPIE